MKVPANPAAEQVQRLTEVNADIDKQVDALRETQKKNAELIDVFNPVAEWVEVADPEPLLAPEVTPVLDVIEPVVDPYADPA